MRIVIDLQGAQTTGSRFRGIGRYSLSLAKAMAREPRGHELWVALNGLFPESVEPLRAAFDGIIPQERIVVWEAPPQVSEGEPSSRWRREAGERLREAFIARLEPDIVHVSSLFEGFGDDALTSLGTLEGTPPTAVTLYDLIPLVQRRAYLFDPAIESWYERKLDMLRRAQLWLAISESSRREGIDCLGLPGDRVINVSTAADAIFRPVAIDATGAEAIQRRYGIDRGFLMYTGGIDQRKNIEGLIRAYARLPGDLRAAQQLAIVCSASEAQKVMLRRVAREAGLGDRQLILTGYIPDADMVALYNLCTAFAFPSWHEGFGLPALEAMSCGAAVVAANTSSLPEVVGLADALFDPHDEESIADRLLAVLTDEVWQRQLKAHGIRQARKFSWEISASRVLDAFERVHREREATPSTVAVGRESRPRLAYLSPLPAQPSGIADYSAELLPELARHYRITLVADDPSAVAQRWHGGFEVRSVDWFDAHADQCDRVLYHFGNSAFHQHMFPLLERHPGTVVLHDFFLSGAVAHADATGYAPDTWVAALYRSHGYAAVARRQAAPTNDEVAWVYPCNLPVLQRANGVIVHSEFARGLAEHWYGPRAADRWTLVPHLRQLADGLSRKAAREALGLRDEQFLLCSFGMVGPTKQNHRMLAAWLESPLAQDPDCRLVFVGENHGGDYGEELRRSIAANSCGERIAITGYAPPELYRRYLAAADAAVQLRTRSRGETSGTILDCMNNGVPAIVNAHGSIAEIPEDCVVRLPDDFQVADLAGAMVRLYEAPELRRALGEAGRGRIRDWHQPRRIADLYHGAIECYAAGGPRVPEARLVEAIALLDAGEGRSADWPAVARAMAANHPPGPRQSELLVDIDPGHGSASSASARGEEFLRYLLLQRRSDCRIEPVFLDPTGVLRYARGHCLRLLGCPVDWLADEPVDAFAGDVYVACLPGAAVRESRGAMHRQLRHQGVKLHFLLDEHPALFPAGPGAVSCDPIDSALYQVASDADGLICASRRLVSNLLQWLDVASPPRCRPLAVGVNADSGCPSASTGSVPIAGKDAAEEFVAAALGRRFDHHWAPTPEKDAADVDGPGTPTTS